MANETIENECTPPGLCPLAPNNRDALRLIDAIRVGDTVTILTPHNQKRSGRAVMRSSHGGWVLNGGGRHGTPLLAGDDNTIAVKRRK